MTGYTPVNE